MVTPTPEEVEALAAKLEREAKEGGYNLNPDRDFVSGLADGLAVNLKRYGYMACPCRRATGVKEEDLDIICPCDYRDADLGDYGACYCGLYVSDEVVAGRRPLAAVPERRPGRREDRPQHRRVPASGEVAVWRCRVCGYLCARPHPPEKCPVCKAGKERFEPFTWPPGR